MPAFDKRVSDFEAANTQVLGISTDSPFSHENWAKSVGISNYPLLSDVHRSVARDYGVYWADWNANNRATFIVDKGGTVRFIERYGKGELPDPDKILAEVKKVGEEASRQDAGQARGGDAAVLGRRNAVAVVVLGDQRPACSDQRLVG